MMVAHAQIPEAVRDVSSPAYNKGRVWVDGGNPVVAEAYAEVHRQDLLSFFTHRAYELAPGGLLFVTCPCRAESGRPQAQTSGEFQNASPFSGMLENSWAELVAEVMNLLHATFGAINCQCASEQHISITSLSFVNRNKKCFIC